MDFTKKDNGLNQYHAWMPYSYTNYDDDIGNGWGSPGAANGVLMQDGWITGGYNALNQPMYITSPRYYGTSNWMYFGYDPLGRCVKRWVGESGDVYSNPATYFHYDAWNLLQEGSNAWGPSRVYVHGNRVDEIVWSYNTFTGEQAFHHYDARGHCTLLTDSGGNILEQYEYDAFGWPYFYDASGNVIGAYDPVQNLWEGYSLFGNRFLFTGREWLPDLKLYDYRNRFYQPELGRFLQPDPKEFLAGDYNLYRYCHNDPINLSDPTGLLDDSTWTRQMLLQGGGDGTVSEQLKQKDIEQRATAAMDHWAPWARSNKREVAGTVNKNGETTVGPEKDRYPTRSNPGPITADTAAIWHLHLMLPGTAPYEFSTGPFGSFGGDMRWLHDYPHLSHFVGVLNAPPGQFHIFASTPDMPWKHYPRLGPQPFPQSPMD